MIGKACWVWLRDFGIPHRLPARLQAEEVEYLSRALGQCSPNREWHMTPNGSFQKIRGRNIDPRILGIFIMRTPETWTSSSKKQPHLHRKQNIAYKQSVGAQGEQRRIDCINLSSIPKQRIHLQQRPSLVNTPGGEGETSSQNLADLEASRRLATLGQRRWGSLYGVHRGKGPVLE